ncbi:MAG: hypothetical protein ACYDEB_00715 [Dehalococcoidia bacterium]
MQGDIRIAELTIGNSRLPSLLGWDLLQHFGITADWANRTISLQ